MGHAYSSILADVFARFMRNDNNKVYFLTGTDEHGLKIQKAAEKRGLDPLVYCDEISKIFRDLTKKLDLSNPLDLKAYQYDIVCNGIELSSGAIRNHIPELMYKLFEIAGYSKNDVNSKFSGMINALSYGAPPHGGIAPGIDRIVMLLANEKNIREVTMFPMNQNAQDLMMNAPSAVSDEQLKELNLLTKKKS